MVEWKAELDARELFSSLHIDFAAKSTAPGMASCRESPSAKPPYRLGIRRLEARDGRGQSKFHSDKSVPIYSACPTESESTRTLRARYLTFEKPEEAHVAIQVGNAACVEWERKAVDGFAVDGHTLRANFGTTKCPVQGHR